MPVVIYTLEDPITKVVRYIGKTEQSLSKRLVKHVHDSKKKTSHRNNWITSLVKQGLRPTITLLEEVTSKDWQSEEKYWIPQFKAWGFDLVNGTYGGEAVYKKGETLIHKYGEEKAKSIKEKQSASQLRLYKTGYTNPMKGVNGDTHPLTGKPKSSQAIANFIKANKGRKNSKESVENIRKGKLGNRKIQELDKNGNLIKSFTSITEIVDTYKLVRQSLLDHLYGKRKSIRGHIFNYITV